MKKIKKYVLWAIAFLTLAAILYYIKNPLTSTVSINNHTYVLEVAATNAEKEKGLGGRDTLPQNHGMVFPFDRSERFSFWMKGMRFPLDFLWIYGNEIIEITENVQVTTNGKITVVQPKNPIDKVIELNAGEVEKSNIKVGDRVVFNK